MKRALVTGSEGFIGSHLSEALISDGVEVVGVDVAGPRFEDTAAALEQTGSFTRERLDVASDPLDEVVDGCDVVFHLAARPGVRGSWGSAFADYVRVNVLGTHRLLEACWRAKTPRVVFASSSSVYGAALVPSGETDDCRPMSPYGVSKLAGEQLCLAYARRHDQPLSVVALRYFSVYGPRQRPDMLFGRMLMGCFTGLPVTLYGDGAQRRDFTYVSDAVAATKAAALVDVSGEVVNVGGGSSVSLIEAIELVAQVTGRPVPLTAVAAQAGDVPATRADLCAARDVLGYRPAVGILEGLHRQVEWLRGLSPDLVQLYAAELSGGGL